MSKESRFRGPFDKQHGKRAQELLKFIGHCLLVTGHEIVFEKVSLIYMPNLATFC